MKNSILLLILNLFLLINCEKIINKKSILLTGKSYKKINIIFRYFSNLKDNKNFISIDQKNLILSLKNKEKFVYKKLIFIKIANSIN